VARTGSAAASTRDTRVEENIVEIALARETDQAMGALLDDTQKPQFEELRREERGGGGRQRNGNGN
jgi:hypothetical protein